MVQLAQASIAGNLKLKQDPSALAGEQNSRFRVNYLATKNASGSLELERNTVDAIA
jgi:hypothetical protein